MLSSGFCAIYYVVSECVLSVLSICFFYTYIMITYPG